MPTGRTSGQVDEHLAAVRHPDPDTGPTWDCRQIDDLVRRHADLLADMVEVMRRLSALEAKRGR